MHVDKADAFALKAISVDESQGFAIVRNDGCRKVLKQLQDRRAVSQAAASDLAHDERMHEYAAALQ